MRILVTGSSGLIGSEVCLYFAAQNWQIHGLDNNQRAVFFGPQGDTRWNQSRLAASIPDYVHHNLDIRDRAAILALIHTIKPDAIVHCAAQPSHDLAAKIPFDDFDTNAVGTLNLLEATRISVPSSPFVFLSTNKVYGDAPNELPLQEQATRWEYARQQDYNGITETCRIDQSKHSLFGASKLAADIMVQEYGRYFGMNTCCLRGGCLTGPSHSGVELHGFLSYLIQCNFTETEYKIFGYQGKQVRDNIHSWDVARFIAEFIKAPRQAQVYNLGGGRANSISILEAISKVENLSGKKMLTSYQAKPRSGDHICYISDLTKIKSHYPAWSITKSLDNIFTEIHHAWSDRSR